MAGEEGLEPSHAGIKIRCLDQLGDSPTRLQDNHLKVFNRQRKSIHLKDGLPNCCKP